MHFPDSSVERLAPLPYRSVTVLRKKTSPRGVHPGLRNRADRRFTADKHPKTSGNL
jgi:hypothetical protein